MTGTFISLDGVDGCGKSTQIKLLTQWFEDRDLPVLVVRDPGGTALGESLREILLHRTEIPLGNTAEMLLYMASRAQLMQEKVLPALKSGQVVITDRFLLANVAYQSCNGVAAEEIWQVGRIATSGRMPDLTFLLDIDPSISFQRMQDKLDRLESRGIDYMRQVRNSFRNESSRLGDSVVTVDASQSIENVHRCIIQALQSKLTLIS